MYRQIVKGGSAFKQDANSEYWKIDIDERSDNLTVFTPHHGMYKLTIFTFGLQNAPPAFQRAMGVILASVRRELSLQYLNDIAVFSNSPQIYMNQASPILQLLYKTDVPLKLKNRKFFADIINDLGVVIQSCHLRLAEGTTFAVTRLGSPTT